MNKMYVCVYDNSLFHVAYVLTHASWMKRFRYKQVSYILRAGSFQSIPTPLIDGFCLMHTFGS